MGSGQESCELTVRNCLKTRKPTWKHAAIASVAAAILLVSVGYIVTAAGPGVTLNSPAFFARSGAADAAPMSVPETRLPQLEAGLEALGFGSGGRVAFAPLDHCGIVPGNEVRVALAREAPLPHARVRLLVRSIRASGQVPDFRKLIVLGPNGHVIAQRLVDLPRPR